MTTTVAYVGASKLLTVTFTNAAAVNADPTSIVLTIREPDGAEIDKTDADMTNTGVGVWTYSHPVTKAGRHNVRVDAEGAVEAAVQPEFYAITKNTS